VFDPGRIAAHAKNMHAAAQNFKSFSALQHKIPEIVQNQAVDFSIT
jgi:hypothetical protein